MDQVFLWFGKLLGSVLSPAASGVIITALVYMLGRLLIAHLKLQDRNAEQRKEIDKQKDLRLADTVAMNTLSQQQKASNDAISASQQTVMASLAEIKNTLNIILSRGGR
jgi:hypothetical protein